MKKLFVSSLLILSAMLAMQSCVKEAVQSEVIKEISIDTTIQAGTVFQLDLGSVYNATKKATIIEQANYFTMSELDAAEGGTTPVYYYTSSLQTAGSTDKVTIAISDRTDGSKVASKDSTIIYVNFTIR